MIKINKLIQSLTQLLVGDHRSLTGKVNTGFEIAGLQPDLYFSMRNFYIGDDKD